MSSNLCWRLDKKNDLGHKQTVNKRKVVHDWRSKVVTVGNQSSKDCSLLKKVKLIKHSNHQKPFIKFIFKVLKTVFSHFYIPPFSDSKVIPRMLSLWCYISDFERRHQRLSLALIPFTFRVGAITWKVTSAPEFHSTPFCRPSPVLLKIKQVCKRNRRSMNRRQPHHLATVCFLSKWGWLLRAANDIEIYAVTHALPLEISKMQKNLSSMTHNCYISSMTAGP